MAYYIWEERPSYGLCSVALVVLSVLSNESGKACFAVASCDGETGYRYFYSLCLLGNKCAYLPLLSSKVSWVPRSFTSPCSMDDDFMSERERVEKTVEKFRIAILSSCFLKMLKNISLSLASNPRGWFHHNTLKISASSRRRATRPRRFFAHCPPRQILVRL